MGNSQWRGANRTGFIMSQLQDGTGSSIFARVDDNHQLHVFGVTETEQNAAVESGQSYNINTGIIALTGSSDSAVFYMKNNESPLNGDSNIVIDTIIVGINSISATVTEDPIVTIVKNPTAGTVVSDATPCPIKSNSNFGSNNSLDSLIYIGADGKTLTDGSDHAIVVAPQGRTPIPQLHIDLPKGASIGVKIDLNTSGGANVYVALACHRKDGRNSKG